MRGLFPKALAILALLGLSACVLPQGGREAPGPNPVTGGEIEVTALDAPAPGARAPGARAPGGQPAKPAAPEATPAGPATPRPQPKPERAAAPEAAPEAEAIPAPEAAVAEPGTPKSEAQIACERRGDLWAKLPDSVAQVCVARTRDAGKSCTTSLQCEGECLARSGTCAPYTPLFGCNDILQDDGRRMTLCLD